MRILVLVWEHPLWSALLALGLYASFAVLRGPLWALSKHPYYNYLADAFLHGQLHLRLIPSYVHDLSLFQGHYYLYWPPLPAVLLLPWVAIWGVQFSDILFTVVLGALNIGLFAFLLRQACRRGVIDLSAVQRGLLVLFLAAGTVFVTLPPYGRIWATGHMVAFLCTGLAYLAAIGLRGGPAFALAGLGIAGALLTRNHLVLVGLWPACYLLYEHRAVGWRRLLGYCLLGLLPVVLAVGLTAAYNVARFGSVLEVGLTYHQMSPAFSAEYQRYGAFNLYYLPINLYYQYVAYPLPLGPGSWNGGSLFLLSPLFVAAFWGLAVGRPRWSAWALLATVVLVDIPILLLMGTGWLEFGPRYTLDFTIPLLLLTAMGIRRWPNWVVAALIAVGIVQYVVGTLGLAAVMP